MSIDVSWSKLVTTAPGIRILADMDSDPRLKYHNGDHVRRMYAKAKSWGVPYDVNLDGAILGHDCVYDELPEKEKRSAEHMRDVYSEFKDVFHQVGEFDIDKCTAMIMSTAGHRIYTDSDDMLIMLDLAELGDAERRVINFWNIHQESKELYNISSFNAAVGGSEFLKSFLLTVRENSAINVSNKEFWDAVVRGVEDTLLMSQTIIDFHNNQHTS